MSVEHLRIGTAAKVKVKVKVNFALQQAMRIQKGRRCIAVLLL